jgi:hypothetical protein
MHCDFLNILTHPIAQVGYGLTALASEAVAIATPILTSRYSRIFASCCTAATKSVVALACGNTAPNSYARDEYCDGLDDTAHSWWSAKLVLYVVPLSVGACMGSIAYRMWPHNQSPEESQAILRTGANPGRPTPSLRGKLVKCVTSIPSLIGNTAVFVIGGAAAWWFTDFNIGTSYDYGENCVDTSINLPIWPYTGTNTSMASRLSTCKTLGMEYDAYMIMSIAGTIIVPISTLLMGSFCILQAKERRYELVSSQRSGEG